MTIERDATLGVYVHVPFCERVCPYCDFAVVAARCLDPVEERRYVDALLAELAREAPAFGGRRLASLYLGGGTPSLLAPHSVARIVEAAAAHFAMPARGEPPEITLEVNPSTLERERLPGFRAAGVNRLSVGVQSFDDTVLRRLGRAHRASEAHRTLAASRAAGFENVSVDLIFAAPGASPAQLERDLDALVAYAPEHVSTYELTIESGTPFALADERGQLVRPGEAETVAAMQQIEARLAAVGLVRYEISSFARPGFESRHNRRYWRRLPVLGIGMGAWSALPASQHAPQGARRENLTSLAPYLEAVEAGRSAAAAIERLAPGAARGEAIFLGLRERSGVSAAEFASEFGGPPRDFFAQAIRELVGAGLLEESGAGDLRATARGRLFADTVARHFI